MALTGYGFSDYMEAQILNWFKGVAFAAAPANTFVGLFTTNPADTGVNGAVSDGTEMSTASTAGLGYPQYGRISIASTGWSTALTAATGDTTGQQISNINSITSASWTNNNSLSSAVTISGVGLWTAATGPNLLFWISITPQPINSGSSFQIGPNSLVLQVD